MSIKKYLFTALLALGCTSAMAQTKTETVFNPHWYVRAQVGGQYTLGEVSFGDLLSPNAQLVGGYNFTSIWGARLGVNAWQSKGGSELFGQDYKWKYNYVAPMVDATVNLTNLFGFKPNRLCDLVFFAGIGANIGFNKNKVTSLGGLESYGWNSRWASTEIGQDYWIAVGGAVGQIRGYVNDGRYEVSDFTGYDAATDTWMLKEGVADGTAILGKIRPGTMKLKKIADDGTNVIGENDQRIIGDVNPDCTGGFALNARLYGFDLSANFNFSVGNDIYNANKIEYTSTSKYQYRNMIDVMADGKRWTNLNPDGTLCNDPVALEALNANTTMWSPYMKSMVLTDWAIEKASFLRLNTLTLGYTLPKELVKKAYINSLRLYASVYNVFCITNYSGYDPESDCIRTTNLTPGVDYSGYPRSRQFVIGLNLNF